MGREADADRGIETYTTAKGPRYRVAVSVKTATGSTRRSLSFVTRGDARAFRDFARRKGTVEAVRVYEAEPTGPTVVTLAEAVEIRLTRSSNDIKPGTVAENRKMSGRSLLPTLGDYPVHTLTRTRIQEWVDARTAEGRASSTVHNEHAFLSSVLKDCVRDGLIATNPCADVRLPRHARRREMVVPTADELTRLLAHMDPIFRPFVYTLATTGMRINEATAMQWKYVDLRAGTLRVEQGRHRVNGHFILETPKSPRSRRTIDLDPTTVTVLSRLPGDRDPDDYLFVGRRGAVVDDSKLRDREWHPARKAAGLRLMNPHDLRHAHASALLGQGLPIEAVSARLGHESTQTTWRLYAHLVPETRRRYVEAVDVALGDVGRGLIGGSHSPSALGQ